MLGTREFDLVGFLIRTAISAVALAVAAWLIGGIRYDSLGALLLAAVIFGLVNAFIKPVLAFVTCPLILLTLGLFTLVINALMMGLTSWVAEQIGVGFHVDSFRDAFFGAIIVSIVS